MHHRTLSRGSITLLGFPSHIHHQTIRPHLSRVLRIKGASALSNLDECPHPLAHVRAQLLVDRLRLQLILFLKILLKYLFHNIIDITLRSDNALVLTT